MSAPEIVALLVAGIIAGSAATSVVGLRWFRRRKSRRWVHYAVFGVLGALVGQLLFSLLGINLPNILSGQIQVADLVIAFVGAIIVIFVADYLRL